MAYFTAGMRLTPARLNAIIPLYAEKLTTETIVNMNSTVYQNDDDLLLPVAANTTYRMFAFLPHQAAANAALKISWTGPAGATMGWTPNGWDSTAAVPQSGNLHYLTINADGNLSTTAVGTTDTALPCGLLKVAGTAGNLQLRWAQRVAQPSNVLMLAGAWLKLEPVI